MTKLVSKKPGAVHRDEWALDFSSFHKKYNLEIIFHRDEPEWLREKEIRLELDPSGWASEYQLDELLHGQRRIYLSASNFQPKAPCALRIFLDQPRKVEK